MRVFPKELQQLTTQEAIERIEQRIKNLQQDYYTRNNEVTLPRVAEDIMRSICDALRGGFTR